MDLLPIIYIVLLVVIIVILTRIERGLEEIARIQGESTIEVVGRLRNEDHERELFKRFLGEDFSRSEMVLTEQQAEFEKWKLLNG